MEHMEQNLTEERARSKKAFADIKRKNKILEAELDEVKTENKRYYLSLFFSYMGSPYKQQFVAYIFFENVVFAAYRGHFFEA